MKIPINKGYSKGYTVYRKGNRIEERITTNKIEYRQRHYLVTDLNERQDYYDCNGDGYSEKLYCKIPFNLSKTCLNIVKWISIILSTIVILYPTFKLNTNSIVPFIIMMIFGPFINIIFEEWQEMKLEKFIHISKSKST